MLSHCPRQVDSPSEQELFIVTCQLKLAKDQASHLPTKSLKEQTKICPGQAKFERYLSQRQAGIQDFLSPVYSWHFSCYSTLIHWLVHGHMTYTMKLFTTKCHEQQHCKNYMSDGKQFTATCEILTAVVHDQILQCRWNLGKFFNWFDPFVLPCNKSLDDWPLGKIEQQSPDPLFIMLLIC